MKQSTLFLLVFLIACHSKDKEEVIFDPVSYEPELEWVTYEGLYPDGKSGDLTIELTLRTGGVGLDNKYTIAGRNYECTGDCVYISSNSNGTYSTMYGSKPSEVVIQLKGSQSGTFVTAGSKDAVQKFITTNTTKEVDLYFKSDGGDRLIAVDDDFDPLTDDLKYILFRRSKPFTVEGYLTFLKDSAEFFELNTRENWVVAKLGAYKNAKIKYFELAKEKFEGLYVKGLAYTVHHVTPQGKEIDALVLRRIFDIRPGTTVK
jgi:hypothetical protein